jgi:hypothetical protein
VFGFTSEFYRFTGFGRSKLTSPSTLLSRAFTPAGARFGKIDLKIKQRDIGKDPQSDRKQKRPIVE